MATTIYDSSKSSNAVSTPQPTVATKTATQGVATTEAAKTYFDSQARVQSAQTSLTIEGKGNRIRYFTTIDNKKIQTDINGKAMETKPAENKQTLEEMLVDAQTAEKSQKWSNGDPAQPTDPFNGPRLWVSDKFPREENLELWNATAKLASDKGIHVSVIEPGMLGFEQAKISAYTKEGKPIGESVVVNKYSNESIDAGISKLYQMAEGTYVNPMVGTTAVEETTNTGIVNTVKDTASKAISKIKGLIGDAKEATDISSIAPKTDTRLEQYSEEQRNMIKAKAKEIATDELMKLQGSDRNFDGFSLNATTPQYYAAAIKELNY